MKNLIIKIVLSFALSVNILWCGLGMYQRVVLEEPVVQFTKVQHSCVACYALALGSWLRNVSWSEWRTWGYHPRYGPSYQEKHSNKP